MANLSATGSRSDDREPFVLDYTPQLTPAYGRAFHEVSANIAFLQLRQQLEALSAEIDRLEGQRQVAKAAGRSDAYGGLTRTRAATLLLRDLLQMGWKIRLNGARLQLIQERPLENAGTVAAKERIRKSMQFERNESLRSAAVQDFVRFMERMRLVDGQARNVLSLVADGHHLAHVLTDVNQFESDEKKIEMLSDHISPYLQLVEGEKRDDFTGLRLMDIWRYFRLSWSTPYRPTPGRNLFYLVRDASQPFHPVMGIAALGNTVIGLRCRDEWIGWTPDALASQFLGARTLGDESISEFASRMVNLLERHMQTGLLSIDLNGISTANAVANPTDEAVAEIEAIAADAASKRYEYLKQEAAFSELLTDGGLELAPPAATVDRAERASATEMFRRKRAAKLAALLRAKLQFQRAGLPDSPVRGLASLLWSDTAWTTVNERGRSALRTILNANKESKIGSAMMEIIVCGGVQPYNHLLGGKLVAMLLTSPEVVADYQQRYGDTASTIASQIAGRAITRPAMLTYLGTSSLYAGDEDHTKVRARDAGLNGFRKRPNGASQYNRIRIPGNITGGNGELKYQFIGTTQGYGVVHFSSETRAALEELDLILHQAKRVNSVFGEGTSPRMRKIRQGISLLGLDDRFLVHGHGRLVYGVELAHNTRSFLIGEADTPDYYFGQNFTGAEATARIARYWIERWLLSRINHAPSIAAVYQSRSADFSISRQYHQASDDELALPL